MEGAEWLNIEIVPDELLQRDIFIAEGGYQRIRSSVTVR